MDTFNINLDIDKAHAYLDQPVIHRIGDKSTKIVASIFDKGSQINILENANPVFKCVLPNGKKIIENSQISDNTISYILTSRFDKNVGDINDAYFEFGSYSTQNFKIQVLNN